MIIEFLLLYPCQLTATSMDSFRNGGILGRGNSSGNGSHAEIHLACLRSDEEISVTRVDCVRERINRRGVREATKGWVNMEGVYGFWMRWSKTFGGKWGTWADSCYCDHLMSVENRMKRGQGPEKEKQCGGCCNNPDKVWPGQGISRGKVRCSLIPKIRLR